MKIAEVSEKFGLSVDTLRYYERIGLIPAISRGQNGIRDYSETDIKRVEFVKCMRRAGLSIETLIEYMALLQKGDQTIETRKELLQEQRHLLESRIMDFQESLELLDLKIKTYENRVLKKEKEITIEDE